MRIFNPEIGGAEVIVTAFNRNLDDPIEGTVSYLAADSQIDELTGESYFTARINIEPEEDTAKRIMAGMFTEVYIQAASRTFMSYLAKPVTDSFRRAFQER